MIPIYTKKIRKKWFCFGTFDGTDYSYTGKTMEQAQGKMKKRLKKSDLEGHGLFMREEIIEDPNPPMKASRYPIPGRIDNNPIA